MTAVATTNQASADRAAAAHGVRHAFADAGELAAHPDVDLVVVSVGSDATLTATPAQPGTFIHWGDWDIRIGDEVLAVPGTYRTVPAVVRSGPPANIAALYREVAQAIAEARQPHPGFETALRHHRLLAAIEQSAATGRS